MGNNFLLNKKACDEFKKSEEYHCQSLIDGTDSIWIVKPVGLSRGRGIMCMNTFPEILHYAITSDCDFVVQKYIERPLIIQNRKFDIRQWALVNSFDPLEIWVYDEFYLRFAATDYSHSNLQDIYTHLTNNSITKEFKGSKPVYDGNMVEAKRFHDFLVSIGKGEYYETIKAKIYELVIVTFQSAQKFVSSRKNSFCVFGYDFMIDEDLNVWLIEVNTSPSMDTSTKVTERMVPAFQRDIVKWIADYHVMGTRDMGAELGNLKRIYKEKKVFFCSC